MNEISKKDWDDYFLPLFAGFSHTPETIAQFKHSLETFLEILSETNEKVNLTAITDFNSSVWKHLFDSLLLTKFEPLGSILDLGSGGGFPGIPLSLFRKFISKDSNKVILLDSIRKKTDCLSDFTSKLEITDGCLVVNDRGENYLKRNKVDLVVMRAVAPPDRAIPWLCKSSPRWLILTGPNNVLEWQASEKKIFNKGFVISNVHQFLLPHSLGTRNIIDLHTRF